jgi:hypothetical protein
MANSITLVYEEIYESNTVQVLYFDSSYTSPLTSHCRQQTQNLMIRVLVMSYDDD